MKICGALAILFGFLVLGSVLTATPAHAQLECELFGCDEPPPPPEPDPDPAPGDEPTDEPPADEDGTGGGESSEESSCALALPDTASDRGKERSANGLARANEARGCVP